ncbi:MAG TPA: flavodoxin domain-containing protein [Yinghuangia sp.]|uniref:flavodoxin domain-containing protein n=1 Tax=Yinghuangia sp. YIM S10712 TaxID=3436930 RepID=UPI002C4EDD2F|nr:flavodoxin domain-containing protein [Yinghuangia sp.]
MHVLVAYATRHGSTRSIAERITTRIAEGGHRVDLRPVGEAHQVWKYGALVAGSAIHNGDWLPEAAEFLHRHAAALATRPVWLFSVGLAPALQGRRGRWLAARAKEPPAVAADREVLAPRDVRTFAGVLARAHLPPLSRPLVRACGGRFGDFRDWAAIDGWAFGIAEKLATESTSR